MDIRTSIDLTLNRSSAFDAIIDELSAGLLRLGMKFQAGGDGRIMEGDVQVGRVVRWQPPDEIALEWHAANWDPADLTSVELRFEPIESGTRVILENRGWGSLLGDQGNELAGCAQSGRVRDYSGNGLGGVQNPGYICVLDPTNPVFCPQPLCRLTATSQQFLTALLSIS